VGYVLRERCPVPDCLFLKTFDLATCQQVVNELRCAQAEAAMVYGSKPAGEVNSAIRRVSRIAAPDATRNLVFHRLLDHKPAIEEHFGTQLEDPEEPQFLRYQAGDFFVAHQDGNTPLLFDESRFRRVSIVIFLSSQSEDPVPGSYGGGSLVLHGAYPDFALRFPLEAIPGTLVAFRSETTHEVTQVTHGERYTVVSWYSLRKGCR